jgi:hypothetical protein
VGTYLGGGGNEDFRVGVGENDRPDVAAVHHCARRRAAELALKFEQSRADLGDGRNPRGGFPDGMRFQTGFGEAAGVERLGSRHSARNIIERLSGIDQRPGHRAVEQAGIEMPQSVMRG